MSNNNYNLNSIEVKELHSIIDLKISLYNKMLNDNKFAFLNFDKFDFYDFQYMIKLYNKSNDTRDCDLNIKIIENIINFLNETLKLNLTKKNYNSFPLSTLYFENNISINLKTKQIYIKILSEINFSTYMIESNNKQLRECIEIENNAWDWIKKIKKHKVTNILYYVFKRKKCLTLYEFEKNRQEKNKIEALSAIKQYSTKKNKLIKINEEYSEKLKVLESYGYKINICEGDYDIKYDPKNTLVNLNFL